MLFTIAQLTEDLVRGGLISVAELQNAVTALELAGQTLTAELVSSRLRDSGLLSAYQTEAVLAGKADELTFGNYLVLDKIGQGGMGFVYKARHRRMKRLVAIKVVSREKINSPEGVARFQHEVETLAQLSHPNIVTAHDADECALGPFLVMEYVAGSDLADRVKKQGPLPVREAVDAITQVARALEYAHSQNIVHRDVKPANMLRDAKGIIKVTDLGLARLLNDRLHGELNANSGMISGTVDFMAPEQSFDPSNADYRVDIYSLGCSLFYLLTGQMLYGGKTIMQRLRGHRELPQRPMREDWPHIPASLEAVYLRMTAKKPNDRYQSMTEAVVAFEKVMESLEGCELEAVGEIDADGRSPVSVPDTEPTISAVFTAITLAEVSVVLVEPSRLQSRVITGQLQALGIRHIRAAATGHEALANILAKVPELVVSSMHLPDMTAAELVQKIRGHNQLRDVAFVLISSETDFEYLEPVRQAGTAAILPKPFDLPALRQAMSVAVDFFSPDAVRVHNLQAAGLRVLIADDSTSARHHIRRVLENLGMRLFAEASDGRKAIELLSTDPFDLVVTDYNMPDVDGPALVRYVRSSPQFQHIPVLMVTSETDPKLLADAHSAGVTALCPKVFDPQTVCRILGVILAGRG